MSLLSYIKRDRVIGFDHWRYRLLHWTFNVEASTPADSWLPGYLYTKWCPLLHLTNALFIMFPIIVFAKCFAAIVILFSRLISMFIDWATYISPEDQEAIEHEERELRRARYIKKVTKYFLKHGKSKTDSEFSNGLFGPLSGKEFDDLLEELEVERVANQEAIKARKKENEERFAFWIRFSEIFVKGFTLFVIACSLTVLGYFLNYTLPIVWSAITYTASVIYSFMWTVSIVSVLSFIVKAVLGLIGITIGVAFSMWAIGKASPVIKEPFMIAKGFGESVIEYFFDLCGGVAEFVSTLYENNCPLIVFKGDKE